MEDVDISHWADLQDKLKYENLCRAHDNELQSEFEVKIKNLQKRYYTQQLTVRENVELMKTNTSLMVESRRSSRRVVIDAPEDHFSEAFESVKTFVLKLRENLDLLLRLLPKLNSVADNDRLGETFTFSFFDCLICQHNPEEDLIQVFYHMIRIEMESCSSWETFTQRKGLLQLMLNQYIKKISARKYLKKVVRGPLLMVLQEEEESLSIDKQSLKEEAKKRAERERKQRKSEKSKIRLMKSKTISNRLSMDERSASFSAEEMKEEFASTGRTLSACSVQLKTFFNGSRGDDFTKLKGILQERMTKLQTHCENFIKSICDNLESMPYYQRLIYKILANQAERKFNASTKERNQIVRGFLFSRWILPGFLSPEYNGILQDYPITDVNRNNLKLIGKILSHILKGTGFDERNEPDFAFMNTYVQKAHEKITNHFDNLFKVNVPQYLSKLMEAYERGPVDYTGILRTKRAARGFERRESRENRASEPSPTRTGSTFAAEEEEIACNGDIVMTLRQENTENQLAVVSETSTTDNSNDSSSKSCAPNGATESHGDEIQKPEFFKKKEILNCTCVALSVSELKILVEVVMENAESDEFDEEFPLVSKLARRINEYAKTLDFFRSSFDGDDLTNYNLHEKYFIIMSELKFPKEDSLLKKQKTLLEEDTPEMKMISRVKIVLSQLLSTMDSLHESDIKFVDQGDKPRLTDIINHLSDYIYLYENRKATESGVPLKLLVKYLEANLGKLSSDYMNHHHQMLYQQLRDEYEERWKINDLQSIRFRKNFLLAINSIEKLLNDMRYENHLHKDYRNRSMLMDFLKKTQIQCCVNHAPEDREQTGKPIVQVKDHENCIHNSIKYLDLLLFGGGGAYENPRSGSSSNSSNSRNIDPNSLPHASTIDEFVELYTDLDCVKQSVLYDIDADEVGPAFECYMGMICEEIEKNPNFNKMNSDQWEQLTEEVEKYIMRKIHKKIYPKQQSEEDIEMQSKLAKLGWVKPEQLDIKEKFRSEEMWALAVEALLEMDKMTSPQEKLEVFVDCISMITDLLTMNSSKHEPPGADDTLPILIYVLIKANPPRLCSNLNFISKFRSDRKMQSQAGYCFMQVKAAVHFLNNITPDQLNMNEVEYSLNVQYHSLDSDQVVQRPRSRTKVSHTGVVKKTLSDNDKSYLRSATNK